MRDDTELSDGLRVTAGVDFPLPPAELADALDNSGASAAPATAPGPAATPASSGTATLRFLDELPAVTVPLRYPFEHDGQPVRVVTVRALGVFETGEILKRGGGSVDSYDFYAAMTGLPASVVRALPGDDGDRVTEAAYGFLPRYLKGAIGASPSTPETGEP